MATTKITQMNNPAYNFTMRIPVVPDVPSVVEFVGVESKAVSRVLPRVGMWMAFKMLFKGYVSPVVQLDAKHALAKYDNPDYDSSVDHLTGVVSGCVNAGDGDVVVGRKPRHDNASWWTVYSLLAHAEFNVPVFSRANEMVVSTWIRKKMHQDGVTEVDTAKVLGLAVRMAFVPTEADILALQYAASPAIRKRERTLRMSHWTAWWGTPVGRANP